MDAVLSPAIQNLDTTFREAYQQLVAYSKALQRQQNGGKYYKIFSLLFCRIFHSSRQNKFNDMIWREKPIDVDITRHYHFVFLEMEILVKTLTRKNCQLIVKGSDTVANLKERVQNVEGNCPFSILFFLLVPKDNFCIVKDYTLISSV